MAKIEFTGFDGYEQALRQLGDGYEDTVDDMIRAACKVLLVRFKAASGKFARHIKTVKVGRSAGGAYGIIGISGSKTKSGAPASLAGTVYEKGRLNYHPQPARPFSDRTAKAAEPDVQKAMQAVYDRKLKELGF